MWGTLLRLLGKKAVHHAVTQQTRGSRFDIRLGLTLFREKRVPTKMKMAAILLGIMGMVLLDVLEIPAEALVALALPIIGVPIDLAWNGLENVVGPVLLSALALCLLVPQSLREQVRQEREGQIIEVVSAPVGVGATH